MLDFLHHLLLPRESNNHRARLLHLKPLFFLVILLLVMHLLTPVVEKSYPGVLGITANISVSDLVSLTNQQREAVGLSPLNLDPQLSAAATNKANDMLAKGYWAHNAPDGTTPWVFIKAAGYEYLYAGENLARGFTTAPDTVNAWMASPGHKENILSPKYKDVGFAIVTGTLTGEDTVLIVQEFGNRLSSSSTVGSAQNQNTVEVIVPTLTPLKQPTIIARVQFTPVPLPTIEPTITLIPTVLPESSPTPPIFIASVRRDPIVNKDNASKNIALILGIFIISLFIIDIVIIKRKNIIRLVSHSIDHIVFLIVILIAVILYSRGVIL